MFLDENLSGKELREALESWGYEVHRPADHFERGTPDVEWITIVGRKGWLLLTKDRAIARKPAELAIFVKARARAFFLAHGDLNRQEIVASVEAALERIARLVKKTRPPTLRKVSPTGHLRKFDDLP